MNVKHYAILYIVFVCLITFLFSTVNYIIDPYSLFQTKRIIGINEKKPTASNRSTLYKPYNLVSYKPRTIVVGNSRPEMGINPESTCWPDAMKNVYNLTFPGQNYHSQIMALYHAVATGGVKNIYLAIDFIDFLKIRTRTEKISWPPKQSEFYDRFLVDGNFKSNKYYLISKAKDWTSTLLSIDTLLDSFKTVFSQSAGSANRTTSGFNPAKDISEITRVEGAWVLFEQKKNMLKKRFSQPGQSLFDNDKDWSLELEGIKQAIILAQKHNIDITLFINPYHYSYLEIIREAGYWPEFKNFKKTLQSTVLEYGNNHVELWDFAVFSQHTFSPIPTKDNGIKELKWFWEPAHYKSEYGDLILSSMLRSPSSQNHSANIYGYNLTQITNIDNYLQQQDIKISNLLEKQGY